MVVHGWVQGQRFDISKLEPGNMATRVACRSPQIGQWQQFGNVNSFISRYCRISAIASRLNMAITYNAKYRTVHAPYFPYHKSDHISHRMS